MIIIEPTQIDVLRWNQEYRDKLDARSDPQRHGT